MTQPQVKPQARVQIYEGMTVEAVKKNGSEGQKLMAPLFDLNQDGRYDANEAEQFNSYNFTTEKGKITLYENNNDGSRQITEIKYDNFEEDVLCMYEGEPLNALDRFLFKNDKGEDCYFAKFAKYTKAVIDMIKGTAQVENAKGSYILGNGIELTIKDSDLEKIRLYNGKLNLQNVKDKGLIWDSATQIDADGKTIVEADAESKVEVKAYKEE